MIITNTAENDPTMKYAVRVTMQGANYSLYYKTRPAAMYAFHIAVNKDPMFMWKMFYVAEDAKVFYAAVYERTPGDVWSVVCSQDITGM